MNVVRAYINTIISTTEAVSRAEVVVMYKNVEERQIVNDEDPL